MVSLLSRDYQTHLCCFYVDSEDELNQLPTHETEGKGDLETVKSCAYGSRATCLNGKSYVLSGENKWVVFKSASSGSSGTNPPSGDIDEDIEPITDDEINSLFKNNGGI